MKERGKQMAKFGFLSVLEEELDKHLDYDFAMDWDKKNHAVDLEFCVIHFQIVILACHKSHFEASHS